MAVGSRRTWTAILGRSSKRADQATVAGNRIAGYEKKNSKTFMSHVSYGTPRNTRHTLHVYYCRYVRSAAVALSRGYRSLVSTAFGVK